MASAKDLRKRITSVKNTQQITKAMKMVSAAKLRRAQDGAFAVRPYSLELKKVLSQLASQLKNEAPHVLLEEKQLEGKKKILLVLVTSDRGLCGAFNGSIIKAAQKYLKTQAASNDVEKVDLAFIGKKGFEFFKGKNDGKYYEGFFTKLNFAKAQALSQEWIELYLSGQYDEIRILFNEFRSVLVQIVNNDAFLPIEKPTENVAVDDSGEIIFEPGPKEILNQLLPKHFAIQIYRACLESLASEHAARMAAMDNATRNAGEMIRKITLLYNKTRQAGITKELLEIVSGSEAQNN